MSDDDMPEAPMSQMASEMLGFHEFYMSAIQAGFNEPQAFAMTLEFLRAVLSSAHGG